MLLQMHTEEQNLNLTINYLHYIIEHINLQHYKPKKLKTHLWIKLTSLSD
jgi:hypothetical protein